MASLFEGVKLFKNGGGEASADALKGKIVGVYFSAHWCGPCRRFTPLLQEFYEQLAGSGEFEIVFLSRDRSEEDMKLYLAESHGPWYYLANGDDRIQELKEIFEMTGIPDLIIVRENGEIISRDGISDILEKSPAEALAVWKSS